MKCNYCPLKDTCNRKWYNCDRKLMIKNNEILCVPKEAYDKVRLKERKRAYESVEKVVFLGYEYNRTSSSRLN